MQGRSFLLCRARFLPSVPYVFSSLCRTCYRTLAYVGAVLVREINFFLVSTCLVGEGSIKSVNASSWASSYSLWAGGGRLSFPPFVLYARVICSPNGVLAFPVSLERDLGVESTERSVFPRRVQCW